MEILAGIIGFVVGGAVCSVTTWAVLRNNPRFLYRGYEKVLKAKLKKAITEGKKDAREYYEEKLREFYNSSQALGDKIFG